MLYFRYLHWEGDSLRFPNNSVITALNVSNFFPPKLSYKSSRSIFQGTTVLRWMHRWLVELAKLCKSFLNLCSAKLQSYWLNFFDRNFYRLLLVEWFHFMIHEILSMAVEICLFETTWTAIAFGCSVVENSILANVKKILRNLFDEHPIFHF